MQQLSTAFADACLNQPYTGEIVFNESGAPLVTIGSQQAPIVGAVVPGESNTFNAEDGV